MVGGSIADSAANRRRFTIENHIRAHFAEDPGSGLNVVFDDGFDVMYVTDRAAIEDRLVRPPQEEDASV